MSSNLIYALIGYGDKPLAQYSEYKGTFQKTCQNYLHSVEPNSSGGYKIDDYFIFYINENGITYLIMTDVKYPKGAALSCLESIKKEFLSSFSNTDFDSADEFGLDKDFKPKLKMKYEYFNENTEVSSEVVNNLKTEMIKMRDEVLEASGLLNVRNDTLNVTNVKAESLFKDSESHKKRAVTVKKTEKKKKILIIIGIVVAVLVILYFIICMICGNFTFDCSSD